MVVFAGCGKNNASSQPPGPVVRKVELEGVHRFDPATFQAHLNLRPTGPFAFRSKNYYIPGLEAVDRNRIIALYGAYGYFDAKVRALDVQVTNPNAPLRRQRAHVHIEVEEGASTKLRRVEFEWSGDSDPALSRDAIAAMSKLEPGAMFSIADLEASRDAMQGGLRDFGYAKAIVVEEAWVDPKSRQAIVRFRLTPGPKVRIGRIDLSGLEHVPKDLVAREIDFAAGQTYSRKLIAQIESAVYGMNVFSSVSATEEDVLADRTLVVQVTVTEIKMQSLKVGVGFGIDPARTEQRASLLYRHENLFHRLTLLSLRLKVGYAELPHLFRPVEHGPIGEFEVTLRKKGLLEKNLVWEERPTLELGIWPGYQFYSVRNRLGVSRFFTRFFELGLSYNNRFVDFFNVSEDLDENATILGADYRDPYIVSFVESIATIHLTDDILEPRNGARLSVKYIIASTYLGGQYDFNGFEPELRAYWEPHDRISFAWRTRIGLILPYGVNPGAPIDLKFYLGGSNDVRGWPLRHIAPRLECTEDPDCDVVPIGGQTLINANAEVRLRAVAELWFAAFFDIGDVQAGVARFDPRGFMYTTGGGLRYRSPIGTLRVDVGGQLNSDGRFPEPRRWALHIGLGEAF